MGLAALRGFLEVSCCMSYKSVDDG